jgi:uncharacterized phage protein gp47/JayE
MPYVAPYIDPVAGFVIPSYADIIADMVAQYLTVYPQVVFLGISTPKYQELSIFALKQYDTNLASQLAYNARSPATAVGADLDSVVKLNGLTRKAAGYSTAPLTVTGVGGTTITNGTVTDTQGYVWALPSPVTIPMGGSLVVTATCLTVGAINAAAGAISTISGGSTAGWLGASNPSAAAPGQPVETDSQLRGRQAISVALPSSTRLAGTIAGIAAVENVTRYLVHENATGSTDADGTPAHSISAVVEGGADLDVATAIYDNKGIGAYTNPGTGGYPVTVDVTDPTTGVITAIGFARPDYVPIYVTMVIHGLTGFSSAVTAAVKAALVAYLNNLQIGETLTFSSLYAVAQSVMPNINLPQFSVTSLFTGTAPAPTGVVDIPMEYHQVVQGISTNVVVTAS